MALTNGVNHITDLDWQIQSGHAIEPYEDGNLQAANFVADGHSLQMLFKPGITHDSANIQYYILDGQILDPKYDLSGKEEYELCKLVEYQLDVQSRYQQYAPKFKDEITQAAKFCQQQLGWTQDKTEQTISDAISLINDPEVWADEHRDMSYAFHAFNRLHTFANGQYPDIDVKADPDDCKNIASAIAVLFQDFAKYMQNEDAARGLGGKLCSHTGWKITQCHEAWANGLGTTPERPYRFARDCMLLGIAAGPDHIAKEYSRASTILLKTETNVHEYYESEYDAQRRGSIADKLKYNANKLVYEPQLKRAISKISARAQQEHQKTQNKDEWRNVLPGEKLRIWGNTAGEMREHGGYKVLPDGTEQVLVSIHGTAEQAQKKIDAENRRLAKEHAKKQAKVQRQTEQKTEQNPEQNPEQNAEQTQPVPESLEAPGDQFVSDFAQYVSLKNEQDRDPFNMSYEKHNLLTGLEGTLQDTIQSRPHEEQVVMREAVVSHAIANAGELFDQLANKDLAATERDSQQH